MAKKADKTTVQERSKKSAKKPTECTRVEAFTVANRARLIEAKKKLAARSRVGIKAYTQPSPVEDVIMTVEDPGLEEALKFSEQLRTGVERAFSPQESEAAWPQREKKLEEAGRLIDQLPKGTKI